MDGEKKMYEGNWKCAGCGSAITKLPFEPRDDKNLKCLDCFKNEGGATKKRKPFGDENRTTYEGNWKCGKCGNPITKLPFEPDPNKLERLKCLDCFKAERA